jgi:uncharacterized protein (DUF849 family)
MERLKWTDEMIELRMASMDEKFDRLLDELHTLREELRADIAGVRADLSAFHRQVLAIVATLTVGFLALLAAAQF